MHLISCDRPAGLLESAPRTSLRADTAHEQWEGYWSGDEKYYARCVQNDGTDQWYSLADEDLPRVVEPHVLDLQSWRVRARRNPTSLEVRGMLLLARPGLRPILVGSTRRRSAGAGKVR